MSRIDTTGKELSAFKSYSLAEEISVGKKGNAPNTQRGTRGRQSSALGSVSHQSVIKRVGATPEGFEKAPFFNRDRVVLPKKREMLYLVRELVQTFRQSPMRLGESFALDGGGDLTSTKDWANLLVNDVQYFDCDEIHGYVDANLKQMYPSEDVPPHPDAVLPAENVGLYVSKYKSFADVQGGEDEVLFICIPTLAGLKERDSYSVYSCMKTHTEDGTPTQFSQGPFPWGNIRLSGPNLGFENNEQTQHRWERLKPEDQKTMGAQLRMVAALLQTINQPRFVVKSPREVSLFKRQSFKKSTGRFTPDSWNLVSWNVDKPTKTKSYKEGSGGRQALHFRRGHWRQADKEWERSRWSGTRTRWEQYIHGYEAGHPAFGVKKSYHLPRKDKS